MKRRQFIRTARMAAAGAIAAPYILPSGRLFAASGQQMAQHVVYVLFAGGVRQQESVLQRYLEDAQNKPGLAGNIMYNILNGDPPTQKIAYGTDPQQGTKGSLPIPRLLNDTIENMGMLLPEMRATSAGHYAGLNTLVTGNTATTQGLKQKPVFPTIFEYTRRHLGIPATKSWFVCNTLLNSYPLLNYSEHENYGASYGANLLVPNVVFGSRGEEHLANAKVYHPEEQIAPMYEMKQFLDNTFKSNGSGLIEYGSTNTEEERNDIKEFIKSTYEKKRLGQIPFPPVSDNGDLSNIGYAIELMRWFKPTLTVINLSNVDGCHSNFTGYLRSLHRADHGVAHLWKEIQNIPEMKDNTVMIMIPECGRNSDPNPILDENDWYAFDHSDQNSLRIFGAMLGPGVPAGLKLGSESNPVGNIQDGVLTVADILGFKDSVISTGMVNGVAMSWFDRI